MTRDAAMEPAPAAASGDDAAADAIEVQRLLLDLGVALVLTGDAVSIVEDRLRAIAVAHGHGDAGIAVLPTMLIITVTVGDGRRGGRALFRTIDSAGDLRLDQATEVIHLADAAEARSVSPAEAIAQLPRILAMPSRYGTASYIASHAVLTVGLGLVIHPAAVDMSVYAALGALVGGMKTLATRMRAGGYLLPVVAAVIVSAVSFLAQGGNEAASLRLTIPPLVTFLPGALLTMATVDLAMGETITGSSRFVAGLLQLALLGIGIIVGAELVGDPHAGPVAGDPSGAFGTWAPWVGVAIFGVGVYVHDSAPRRSLPWLLTVLFAAWIGQLAGEEMVGATLSGFVGAAVMVPVAHLVARQRSAPPAHVMFLPAFWLLVPGTIGLIGVAEIFGSNGEAGTEHISTALASIPSVALGTLVGTLVVRSTRMAAHARVVPARLRRSRRG